MTQPDKMPSKGKIDCLSRRELQIALSYAAGRSYRDIAEKLYIAPSTVRTHIGTIYRKLEVSSKIELLKCLRSDPPDDDISPEFCRAPQPPKSVTITVLPIRGPPDESSMLALGEGLQEDLITKLAGLYGYSVIAHSTCLLGGSGGQTPWQARRPPGAQFVIDGSLRKTGRVLRLTVFLIEAKTGRYLWAAQYDRTPSAFLLGQDDLAGELVATIAGHIHPAAPTGAVQGSQEGVFTQVLPPLGEGRRHRGGGHRGGGMWSEVGFHDFLSSFKDPRFRQMIHHWLALRQEQTVPHRGAVDPARFKDSRDMVWLMERHDDGHYRYRLAGKSITEIHGGIGNGTDTASLFSWQALDMFRPRWQAVLDRGQLLRAEGIVMLAGGNRISRVERLMLPLRSDNGSVSLILGATHYDRPQGRGLTATDFPPTDVQYCPLNDIPLGSCR